MLDMLCRFSCRIAFACCLLLAACARGSNAPGGTFIAPGVVGASNVASLSLEGEGNLWILLVPEDGKVDLNEDGDTFDVVTHVYDVATDELTNLGLPANNSAVRGRRVLMAVNEVELGEDVNNDGDAFDRILHAYDADTRLLRTYTATPYSGITEEGFAVVGDDLFYVVHEEPGRDLDGDGSTNGSILHRIDLAAGSARPINLRLSVSAHSAVAGDGFGINVIETAATGDLNMDGDESDVVFHVFDDGPDLMVNSGLAAEFGSILVSGLWIVPVIEAWQGGQDLNGNGTPQDGVFFAFDPVTGLTWNLDVSNSPAPLFSAAGEDAAVLVGGELSMRRDLNDDGDLEDWVPMVYRPLTDETLTTGVALGLLGTWTFLDGWFAFQAGERHHGQDLNDDGDLGDTVVVVSDLATGRTQSLGLEAPLQPGPFTHLVLFRNERDEAMDFNGDGDELDFVFFLWDGRTQELTNTQWATLGVFDATRDRYLFPVFESFQGEDLNGDGDFRDGVVVDQPDPQGFHIIPRRLLDFRVAEIRYHSVSLVLALVEELDEDLNGDGDTLDEVFQVLPYTGPV